MVFLLTAFGIYTQYAIVGIFLSELLLLTLCFSRVKAWAASPWVLSASGLIGSLGKTFSPYFSFLQFQGSHEDNYRNSFIPIVTLVLMSAAFFCILLALLNLIANIGTVFVSWDAVASWNRWATDWSQNRLPQRILHYPQLLPANWSVSYVFMGQALQFFPKAFMPLFMLSILALMFDLGISRKSFGYFAGVVVVAFIYRSFLISEDLRIPLTDMPVTFFTFLSVCCLIAGQGSEIRRDIWSYLVLGGIFSAGAAISKQGGLYIVLLYPLLAHALIFKRRQRLKAGDTFRFLLLYFAIISIVVIPSYAYSEIRIAKGLDGSEIGWVTSGIYHGEDLMQRFINAIGLFTRQIGYSTNIFLCAAILILMSIFVIIALLDRSFRWIMLLVWMPYTVIWALYYSYDIRNCSTVLPFFGLGVGIGVERSFSLCKVPLIPKIQDIKNYAVIIIALGLMVSLNYRYTPSLLKDRHQKLVRQIGRPALNNLLYDYKAKNGIEKKILSNYQLIDYMPELKGLLYVQCFETKTEQFPEYLKNISNPEIGYILIPQSTIKKIVDDVEQRLKKGDFELISRTDGYVFAKINRRDQ